MKKLKKFTILQAKNYQKNLEDSMDKLHQLAKENRWMFKYDKISDVFYYSSPKISDDSALLSLDSDNLAIRINNKGIVEGLMIDNFCNIFIPENVEFQELANLVTKTDSKSKLIREKVKAWGCSLIFVIRKMAPMYR